MTGSSDAPPPSPRGGDEATRPEGGTRIEFTPQILAIAPAIARRYARRYGHGNPDVLDELTSVAYLQLVRSARTWKPGGGMTLSSWLYGATEYAVRRAAGVSRISQPPRPEWRHLSLDATLAAGGEERLSLRAYLADPRAVDPSADLERRELVALALRRLSVFDRHLIRLCVMEEEPMTHVAARLGTSLKRVGHRLRAALLRLRRSVVRWGKRPAAAIAATQARYAGGHLPGFTARGLRKGRHRQARNRRRERQRVGWPALPALQGRLLALLADAPGPLSTDALTARGGCALSTTRNALAALKAAGLVVRAGGGGPGGAARYRITPQAVAMRTGKQVKESKIMHTPNTPSDPRAVLDCSADGPGQDCPRSLAEVVGEAAHRLAAECPTRVADTPHRNGDFRHWIDTRPGSPQRIQCYGRGRVLPECQKADDPPPTWLQPSRAQTDLDAALERAQERAHDETPAARKTPECAGIYSAVNPATVVE